MPTLQIRNIPQKLYDDLEQSAKDSRRSLTQEAIVLLEKALADFDFKEAKKRRKEVVKQISRNRRLSEEEANLAIRWIREDRESRSLLEQKKIELRSIKVR